MLNRLVSLRSVSSWEPSTRINSSSEVAFESELPVVVSVYIEANILFVDLATSAVLRCMHVDTLPHTARVGGKEWGQEVRVLLSSRYCISEAGVRYSYRANCCFVPNFS